MTRHTLCSDDLAALKTATRRLIRAAGGVESAASVSRVQKSSLSDYQNPALPDHFMPIDIVLELERDTGTHPVTQALARLADSPPGDETRRVMAARIDDAISALAALKESVQS